MPPPHRATAAHFQTDLCRRDYCRMRTSHISRDTCKRAYVLCNNDRIDMSRERFESCVACSVCVCSVYMCLCPPNTTYVCRTTDNSKFQWHINRTARNLIDNFTFVIVRAHVLDCCAILRGESQWFIFTPISTHMRGISIKLVSIYIMCVNIAREVYPRTFSWLRLISLLDASVCLCVYCYCTCVWISFPRTTN